MKRYIAIFYSILIIMGFLNTGCNENPKLFTGGFTETNEKGLSIFEFSEKDGSLKLISEWDAGANPSFFCFSREHNMIYALNEVMQFNGNTGSGLTTLKYDPEKQLLDRIGELVVPYGGGCHISMSADGGFLFIASYASGSVAVVKLDDKGIPQIVSDTLLYVREAPDVSHAHMISQDPAGKHVCITDLGLDRIMIYDFDKVSGKLNRPVKYTVSIPKGSGPRHFVFNSDGSRFYLINELGSTVMMFNVDQNGGLNLAQTLSTLDQGYNGKNSCAEIFIGKGGKFLYGSNRGENTIVVFKIKDDGSLALAGRSACGGDWPRNFVIDPSGKFLLAGNQKSDDISVFKINATTGIPEGPVAKAEFKQPACLEFWK
jgi:6-phosphogluconolactonase